MSYASATDLTTYGLPATALGQLTSPQILAALVEASSRVDSFLRGRFALPLLSWETDITQATCAIAAYNLLSIRGYNPGSGADINIRDRYLDTLKWLAQVQKNMAHPNVTPSAAQTTSYAQPNITTSSVISLSSGRTARNRGW